MGEFRLLVVSLNPQLGALQRHQHHQGLARLDPVAHLYLPLGDIALDLGGDLGIAQVEAGLLQFGFGFLDGRLVVQGDVGGPADGGQGLV